MALPNNKILIISVNIEIAYDVYDSANLYDANLSYLSYVRFIISYLMPKIL